MKGKKIAVLLTAICLFALALGLPVLFFFCAIMSDTPAPDYHTLCEQASKKLQPLVEAIESYKKETGKYPQNLQELIPKFISSLPELSKGFYIFKDDKDKGIDYYLVKNPKCQEYSLSVMLARASLSSDITLYYRKDIKLQPTSSSDWQNNKYKIDINKNWVYCY